MEYPSNNQIIHFVVPGEPQGKGRPRFVRSTGQTYTPPETKRYQERVQAAYYENVPPDKRQSDSTLPCAALIVAFFSIPKSTSNKKRKELESENTPQTHKPDSDNIAKIVLDALNGIAYHDDSAVTDLTVIKRYGREPRVEVTIEPIETRYNT